MLLFHFLCPFFEVACVAYENRKLFLITAADYDEEVCSDVKMANHISREREQKFWWLRSFLCPAAPLSSSTFLSTPRFASRNSGSLHRHNANNIRKLINIHLRYKRKLMVRLGKERATEKENCSSSFLPSSIHR